MVKKVGRLYKMIVIILGSLSCLGSLYIAYKKSSSIVSLNDSSIQSITFYRIILISWLIIFTISLLLYGIGIIIESLSSINDNIISLKDKGEISDVEYHNIMNNSNDDTNYEIWKRPNT